MNRKELMFGYDREVDVLYISLGKPEKGMQYIELNSNLILRLDPKSKEIVGITIIDFSKQFSGERYFIQISTSPLIAIHQVASVQNHLLWQLHFGINYQQSFSIQ